MAGLRVEVHISGRSFKYKYQRACQLLGTTMSRQIQQTMQATIRRAERQFPQAFTLMTPEEESVYDAIEEQHTTVVGIQMFTRFDKPRVLAILDALVERDILRERAGKGSEPPFYVILR